MIAIASVIAVGFGGRVAIAVYLPESIARVVDFLEFRGRFFEKALIILRNAIGMPDKHEILVGLVDLVQRSPVIQS
jgi:hypothetical protein